MSDSKSEAGDDRKGGEEGRKDDAAGEGQQRTSGGETEMTGLKKIAWSGGLPHGSG